MFSTDFIFRQQENLVDNQKCLAGFRPLCNKILFLLAVRHISSHDGSSNISYVKTTRHRNTYLCSFRIDFNPSYSIWHIKKMAFYMISTHTLHRIVRGNDRRTYFPYQCVAGRDHRYYIKGVIHKLRWQDEVGRWYWKFQFTKVILKKIRHLC